MLVQGIFVSHETGVIICLLFYTYGKIGTDSNRDPNPNTL